MTREDYRAFAKALAIIMNAGERAQVTAEFVEHLEKDNLLFNKDRFIEAVENFNYTRYEND